ncbi:hypothetical protein KB244_001825 [Escherichia coli]|nr:hypothetical protein [Escherichia coli]EFB5171840.1 hypothetical protein [Escherichia coli]EFD0789795.1 hypothetical protein [Escherichia coli]EHJ7947905.1 hypothetical protein [Escherichia coli]TGG98114.1 hypothetical protein E5S61_22810 [Escherichia coli]
MSAMTSLNGVIVKDLAPCSLIFIRLSNGMATFVSDVIANKMFIRAAGEGGAVRNWSIIGVQV